MVIEIFFILGSLFLAMVCAVGWYAVPAPTPEDSIAYRSQIYLLKAGFLGGFLIAGGFLHLSLIPLAG